MRNPDTARSTRSAPTDATDAELLTRGASDRDAFGVLYDRHVEAVLRFHYARTGSPHLAADLTAETFADAFATRRRYRDTGAPGRAWLFTIARRQLTHYWRREAVATRARRRLMVDTVTSIDDAAIERIEQLADLGWVRDAVDELPETLAKAVWLRIGLDLPYAEVATQLGCSQGAARVRVSRGLAALTDAISGDPS